MWGYLKLISNNIFFHKNFRSSIFLIGIINKKMSIKFELQRLATAVQIILSDNEENVNIIVYSSFDIIFYR